MNSVSSFRETFWLHYCGTRGEGDGGGYSLKRTTVGDPARIPARGKENRPSCDALMADSVLLDLYWARYNQDCVEVFSRNPEPDQEETMGRSRPIWAGIHLGSEERRKRKTCLRLLVYYVVFNNDTSLVYR